MQGYAVCTPKHTESILRTCSDIYGLIIRKNPKKCFVEKSIFIDTITLYFRQLT